MVSIRLLAGAGLIVLFSTPSAMADTYQLILQGKVVMDDGSVPPQSVGIERVCDDQFGDAPGPQTDKKTGAFVWRMEVDPFQARKCTLRATLKGYQSTQISIAGMDEQSDPHLAPLVLTPAAGDPNRLAIVNSDIPSKAEPAWKAALTALNANQLPEVEHQLQAAVAAVPKFTQGWSVLGIVANYQDHQAVARDAFEHAIAADPKLLPPYVSLARLCIKTKDWECAAKTSDALIKADSKKDWPEIYLHQAVARYWLKDLNGAQASAEKAITVDRVHHRSEYILGRILEAKGDLNGAREHMSKYIQLDPSAKDIQRVKAHLENLGKPSEEEEPALEVIII